jgi:hypothetical protein
MLMRNLKRFFVTEGVDPKEKAMMGENVYEIDQIKEISQLEGKHSPVSKHSYLYGITYVGYPDDVHWVKHNEIRLEKAMVEWCLKNKKWGWIDIEARKIHSNLIHEDTKRKAAEAEEVAKVKAAKKSRNMEKHSKRRLSPEEKALEGIQKRARK